MSDILTKICDLKRKELESLKNNQDFVGIKRTTEVRDFLSKLGYSYSEETDNPAYQLFASGGKH